MLTYSMKDRGAKSKYEYICDCIRKDILSGVLPPDTRLPSKRAFAGQNDVSVVTVENAYGRLAAEGYIRARPKSGFYVVGIEGETPNLSGQSDLVERSAAASPDTGIDLVSGHTAPENFPFAAWANIMRRLLAEQSAALMTPPPPGGVMELRRAIAKHLHDFRGIDCAPEQVIVGAGTEYLYHLLVQLLGYDRLYGLEDPGPRKLRSIYGALGADTVPLEMDGEGIVITPENLALPEVIQISPSHHFPTGIVTPVSRRYGLLQWASGEPDRYIIEDDYDSEFRLQGSPIPSLFSIDASDRVIYLNTFTKTLASTVRISYMVLPRPLLQRFYDRLGFYSCTVSNFEQYTLARFIDGGYLERHISRMRVRYRRLRNHLIAAIQATELGKYVTVSEQDSGLHFLLHIDTSENDASLKKRAEACGIALSFLSDYCSAEGMVPSRYAHTAVISYSALGDDRAEEAARALAEAFLPAARHVH